MHDDPSPLHDDKETKETWVSDELAWNDVYSKKPEEYLEAIARGEVPRWDSDAGKYAYGNSIEETVSMGGKKSVVDPQSEDEPSDDLPF
jgi:hypothetical protein